MSLFKNREPILKQLANDLTTLQGFGSEEFSEAIERIEAAYIDGGPLQPFLKNEIGVRTKLTYNSRSSNKISNK